MEKINGRLFTFGCSLTRYHWPTWADILGRSYKEHHNWGNRGAGNRQIMERFLECLSKTSFTSDDVIVIQWTDFHRFDYHITDDEAQETWYPGGSLFANTDQDPTKGFIINKMWSEDSYMMHSFNYMLAVSKLVQATRCRVLMAFSHDARPYINMSKWQNYRSLLQNNYFIDGDMYDWLVTMYDKRVSFKGAEPGNLSDEKFMDYHPTPEMHFKWLNDKLNVKLNIQLDKQFAKDMQKAVESVDNYQDIGQAILDAGYDTNKNYVRGY